MPVAFPLLEEEEEKKINMAALFFQTKTRRYQRAYHWVQGEGEERNTWYYVLRGWW